MSALLGAMRAALGAATSPASSPASSSAASSSAAAATPSAAPSSTLPLTLPSIEALELELLLEALFQARGYDFRGYQREALRHKVHTAMLQLGAGTISAMQGRFLHDPKAAGALLRALYVAPAEMFDDAAEVAMLRLALGAGLHGAALPRVWLADCAGAQQAWTLAILLEQEQLGAHTEIYATVANDELLAEAQQAALPLSRLADLQENYARSGGAGQLLDYFEVDGQRAVLLPRLRERIIWAQYNLVTDASFNEFQLIVGRRALRDFGPQLRLRVLKLFDDSLAPFGMLGLDRPLDDGASSAMLAGHYRPLAPGLAWYKRSH